MDRDAILARLHLHAVLPRLGDLVLHDSEARGVAGNWRNSIQLSVLNGPTGRLCFDRGQVTHHRSGELLPSLGLLFPKAAWLNTMFQGGTAIPIPWIGAWHVGLIKGFTKLAERLDHFLGEPDRHRTDPTAFPLVVRLMAATAFDGVTVLAEHDPHCAAIARKVPEGVAEMRIRDTDIAVHMTVAGGRFVSSTGRAPSANVVLEFKDLDTAFELFQGRLEAMAALASGDITITGLIPMFDELSAIMDRLSRYLG